MQFLFILFLNNECMNETILIKKILQYQAKFYFDFSFNAV